MGTRQYTVGERMPAAGARRVAELAPADRGMLEFVERLTPRSGRSWRIDVDTLREVGFDDTGVHDIVQVVALFSYYNRLADGLGAENEPRGQLAATPRREQISTSNPLNRVD